MTNEEALELYTEMEKQYGELPSHIHEPQRFESLYKMLLYKKQRTTSQLVEVSENQ